MLLLIAVLVLFLIVVACVFLIGRVFFSSRLLKSIVILCVVVLFILLAISAYAYQSKIRIKKDEMPPLPNINPVDSVKDLYPDFKLSGVTESIMLNLINILIGEKGISAEAVEEGANQLKTFLEQARTSEIYPFPEYLKLPEGEINYAFDDVESVEDCLKQMRALDKQLRTLMEDIRPDPDIWKKIAVKSRNLTIRGKDAIFFGYPNGRNGKSLITDEETWLYAEYVFFGVVNEYIYGECTSAELLDMYYRLAQIFDYLGGIADTGELGQEMDFIAVICGTCAFEELGKQGWLPLGSAYGTAVWGYYRDIIYRIALAVNAKREDPTGFFELMKTVDENLENSGLSEDQINSIKSTFKDSKLYDDWRKENEE